MQVHLICFSNLVHQSPPGLGSGESEPIVVITHHHPGKKQKKLFTSNWNWSLNSVATVSVTEEQSKASWLETSKTCIAFVQSRTGRPCSGLLLVPIIWASVILVAWDVCTEPKRILKDKTHPCHSQNTFSSLQVLFSSPFPAACAAACWCGP